MNAVATLLNPPSSTAASRSIRAAAPLHLWHLSSLDAPTVAVAWAWSLAWAAHRPLPLWSAAALGLIVWVIYIGDRLLDAKRELNPDAKRELKPDARSALTTNADQNVYGAKHLRERHFFHWRHRRVFLAIALLAGLAAAALVLAQLPAQLPEKALPRDSLVAAATLVWLGSVHLGQRMGRRGRAAGEQAQAQTQTHAGTLARERLAEIVVGIIFALGCALPAWPRSAAALPALALFAALAWLNLYAIGEWESPLRRTGLASPLRGWGVQQAAAVVAIAGLALAILAVRLAEPRSAAVLLGGTASALLLALLDRCRSRLSPLTLRAAADLVLLTPLAFAAAAFLAR
jgi:hypothetical protein